MGYKESLQAAGAEVIDFNEFGSYQGDWAALVRFNGELGFVFGSYGSCSGCDAFQSAFDYSDSVIDRDGKFYRNDWDDEEIPKEQGEAMKAEYDKRLADFGLSYINPLPLETAESIRTKLEALDSEDWFDGEKKEMYEWCLASIEKITN